MITKTKMKPIKGPEDVPDDRHYAVIIYATNTVHIPGDQRSRDAPGHGYPEHTEVFNNFEHWVTTEREILNAFLEELEVERSKPFSVRAPYVFFEVAKKGHLHRANQVSF
jgi:hypothetical protein